MNATLVLVTEPVGQVYEQILRLAAEVCASFSLVWRDQLEFDASAQAVGLELSPFLMREERTSEWPGTQLLGHEAIVRHYKVCQGSMGVLLRATGLYAWLSPELPEDLTFYLPNGVPWLTSIAHENDARFTDLPEIESKLREQVPRVEIVRAEDRV
jgi:hypothetical protein